MNKEKTCVIISSYLPTYKEIALTSLTIEGYKTLGFDVCLTSHTPIPSELQKACNYSIYTDENPLMKWRRPVTFYKYHQYPGFTYYTGDSGGTYSFAILLNLWDAMNILKDKGYTHFLLADNDSLFDTEDGKLLLSHMEESNFYDLDIFGYKENDNFIVSSFFGGKISTWLNIMNKISTPEKYLDFIDKNSNFDVNFGQHGYKYQPTLECFIHDLITNGFLPKHKIYAHPLRYYFRNKWQGKQGQGKVFFPLFETSFICPSITKEHLTDTFYLIIDVMSSRGLSHQIQLYRDGELIKDFTFQEKGVNIHWWRLGNEGEKFNIKVFDEKQKLTQDLSYTKEQVLNNFGHINFHKNEE